MELELLKQLSQFGILGIILALVGWISLQLWRDLKVSWQDRITENKHLITVIEATNSTYAALAQATENRARATEAMAQAQKATTAALEAQLKMLEKVSSGNDELIRCLDRVHAQGERLREDMAKLEAELRARK